jgi:sortase (surface protein transpeptidase)
VALAVVAVIALVVALTGQQAAPRPAAAAGSASASASADSVPEPADEGPAEPAAPPSSEPPAPAEQVAAPVSVSVPAIGVESSLVDLGLNADGTVEVPPLERDDEAGWYTPGPAPGEVGPAILLGHVDSAEWGPGVFFELGAMEPGDEISVARADGSVAVFAVDRVEVHRKDDFPTIEVYGNTDDPQLRLITCGGAFDAGARSYEDNVIVFASLVDTRSA